MIAIASFSLDTYFCFIIAREDIVGFYSTGPKIKENDLHVCILYIIVILFCVTQCILL